MGFDFPAARPFGASGNLPYGRILPQETGTPRPKGRGVCAFGGQERKPSPQGLSNQGGSCGKVSLGLGWAAGLGIARGDAGGWSGVESGVNGIPRNQRNGIRLRPGTGSSANGAANPKCSAFRFLDGNRRTAKGAAEAHCEKRRRSGAPFPLDCGPFRQSRSVDPWRE